MLQNPDWFSIDPDAAETAAAEVEEIAEAVETPVDVDPPRPRRPIPMPWQSTPRPAFRPRTRLAPSR